MIRAKRVSVDGAICTDAGCSITTQTVSLDDEVIQRAADEVHLLLHKPVDYSCSKDPREAPLVDELVPEQFWHRDLVSIGRLDRDTSGFLILTTDGALVHRLTHPKHKVTKSYVVTFDGELPGDAAERCEKGIVLKDEENPTLPAQLELLDSAVARLTIREGRYHQVRRMFASLGVHVTALHRDRIGTMRLPEDLPAGDCRELTAQELELLTGG